MRTAFAAFKGPFLFAAMTLHVPTQLYALAKPPAPPKTWEEFSAEHAFEHVRRLVDLGPRPSGSTALEQARVYITEQLARFGWEVERQAFNVDTPRGKVEFVNLIARLKPAAGAPPSPSFLLASHYDTKQFDVIRFVGANDAGSSTGLLLELARVLAPHRQLAGKVQLVFFDGEEAFESFTDEDGLYGSRHFAAELVRQNRVKQFRAGIVFDLVGDKSLSITFPPDSPVELVRGLFASAEALDVRRYFSYFDRNVTDDHTPLNAAGIPTIDVIDFEFPAWHTAGDDMNSISAESLGIVGRVALHYLTLEGLK